MKATDAYYRAKAQSHQRRADEYRRMAFGGSTADGFAVNKDGDDLTFNMKEVNKLTKNGDYRLVHAYADAEQNNGIRFAQRIISLFETDLDALDQYRTRSREGSIQQALVNLFTADKTSLTTLLRKLESRI